MTRDENTPLMGGILSNFTQNGVFPVKTPYLERIPKSPLSRSGGEGSGVRVARIAAGFLDRLRRSLALTPTLSRRERWLFGMDSYFLG